MASVLEAFDRGPPTVVHRLHHWVDQTPQRPCVFYGENALALSFEEFDQVTSQMAASLAERGARAGSRVAVCSCNVLLSVITMFATWKLRAVYCPVNPDLPKPMVVHMMGVLQASIAVCDARSLELLESATSEVPILVCLDEQIALAEPQSVDMPDESREARVYRLLSLAGAAPGPAMRCPDAEDVASVIFTSGTTGQPKGVVQSHAWLRGLCATQAIWTHTDDVIHCDLPMHHIGGAFSLFARGIWSGAATVLWDRFSASQFWARINQYNASIALLLDVMSDWLIEQTAKDSDRNNSLGKVHMQPLPDAHHAVAQRFGIDFVLVGYGSSEVGNAMLGCIDEFGVEEGTPARLWRGFSKDELRGRLCELHGEAALVAGAGPVPAGLVGVPSGLYDVEQAGNEGRLLLRPRFPGVLFDGYLDESVHSADEGSQASFLTPDLVKRLSDGRFCFRGRIEGFLRVRGENVSAAAVEQVFLAHAGILRCAAVGVPAVEGAEDCIVVFAQAKPGQELQAENLLRWAASRLPTYMRPEQCRVVEELPLTSTMKVNRGALRTWATSD